ncbi:MAG: hypothetical protein NZO16_03355 [Deltaproteobacteria bacterium]|nr:hypothetical protein [Deltaproteobacteria bacterium]
MRFIILLLSFFCLSSESKWVITSDQLEGDLKSRNFLYRGNVKIQTNKALISCDQLRGIMDHNQKIKELVATGSVHVVNQDGSEVFGDKAVFNETNRTLSITGSPKVVQNKNSLSAKEIIYFLDTGKFEAVGNVETIVYEENENSAESETGIGSIFKPGTNDQ